MKKNEFKIGDIVQFGTIKTKVVKLEYTAGGCKHCALYSLCDPMFQYDIPVEIETEFNKMTDNCSAIDIDGKSVFACFEEIIETKDK